MLAPIATTQRRAKASQISTIKLQNLCPERPVFGNNELDSHADTCVLGANFVITQYTGRECDVVPYNDQYAAVTGVPIVSGATAWTDPDTADTWIIIIHEAVWMADSMSHSLWNPNQLRAYGIDVEDNPSRGQLHIASTEHDFKIPLLKMLGTNVLFESRTPTQQELDGCQHIHLTSPHTWIPETAHEKFHQISALSAVSLNAQFDPAEIFNPNHFFCPLNPERTVYIPALCPHCVNRHQHHPDLLLRGSSP